MFSIYLRTLSFLFFLLFFLQARILLASDLEIIVDNLRNSSGFIRFALYNKEYGFPENEHKIDKIDIQLESKKMKTVFKNLSPGNYAVAMFHDENGNNEFDKNFFGFPLEGFGFSNDAKIFFGPPTFKDAAVEIGNVRKTIKIEINYW